ncbi:hypothetical protein I546_1180 [Mycobacterium kansasii 732]|nr:hypothetical protein I546_1180 [Mycobacterium kansasii 732]
MSLGEFVSAVGPSGSSAVSRFAQAASMPLPALVAPHPLSL